MTRVLRLVVLLVTIPAASCRTNARDEPKTPALEVNNPTSNVAAIKVEVIQTAPCPAAARPQGHPGVGCKTLETVLADLDHDGVRDCVRWTRCGPDGPTLLRDGGFAYPRDTVTAHREGDGTVWALYTNELTAESEQFEELSVLRFGTGDERVLARVAGYGTGNIHVWDIVDIIDGAPRRWAAPPLQAAFTPLLGAEERIGKQYARAVEVVGGLFELSWLVYRSGDANCCPSGGIIKAHLVPTATGLQPGRVWRELMP